MNLSVKPVLTGEKTVLRPFTADDADAVAEILRDPEVIRFTFPADGSLTPERLRAWYGSRSARDDRLDLAVTDRSTGELLGEVVLYEWVPEARACTFRTLLGPRGRGRGTGTEAIRLLLEYAFGELGLHRVQLEAWSDNSRALHVYRKVGFVVEGVRRQTRMRDGAWADEVLMAVLEDEWAGHHGRPATGAAVNDRAAGGGSVSSTAGRP
ncbi:GNAT family N-acetyltransferase [Streptomyces sp. NPDC090306]|uniref:GNAT family N-acetyltransferase n=1 Tax=Streptomyces sp. NPDC090306 TaxID=3365961 RepID=UPI0037F69A19